MSEYYDVVVIGGGPAGMAAAYSAWQHGAGKILLLERLPRLGGILNQCIHVGFGLRYFKEELTGPEYAQRYRQLLEPTSVSVLTSAFVTRINREKEVTFINREGERSVKAGCIIVATGCRERTREMLTVPGSRPSGVFTAGLAQEMVNLAGILPGKNVVVVGSGDIGLIMARRMSIEGAVVHAVLEIREQLSGLIRNKIQCLDDFGIPLYLAHELLEIIGANRVEAVRYRSVMTGKIFTQPCDTVLFSVGLIPEQDLLLEAGIKPGEGIYITGNAEHVHDLADNVTREAEQLGSEIAALKKDCPVLSAGR